MATDKLDLPSKYRRQLEGIFEKHLPEGVEVLAYGSRVTGGSHPGSDLDLALKGHNLKKIPPDKLNALRTALRESSIPFLVEVRDLVLLPKSFQLEIEQNHIVLFSTKRDKINKLFNKADTTMTKRETAAPPASGEKKLSQDMWIDPEN